MYTAIPVTTRLCPPAVNFSGHGRFASAISQEAESIRGEVIDLRNYTEQSQVLFGEKAAVISELHVLAKECSEEDWDGYGAHAVDPEAVKNAAAFIRALPGSLPLPEIAIEPDGSVSLDWIRSRHQQIGVSISASDRFAVAWLDGADKGHAVVRFDGECVPQIIMERIRDTTGELNYDSAAVGTV